METGDDRPLALKWSRTWPDDPTSEDLTGIDPAHPTALASPSSGGFFAERYGETGASL